MVEMMNISLVFESKLCDCVSKLIESNQAGGDSILSSFSVGCENGLRYSIMIMIKRVICFQILSLLIFLKRFHEIPRDLGWQHPKCNKKSDGYVLICNYVL